MVSVPSAVGRLWGGKQVDLPPQVPAPLPAGDRSGAKPSGSWCWFKMLSAVPQPWGFCWVCKVGAQTNAGGVSAGPRLTTSLRVAQSSGAVPGRDTGGSARGGIPPAWAGLGRGAGVAWFPVAAGTFGGCRSSHRTHRLFLSLPFFVPFVFRPLCPNNHLVYRCAWPPDL